MFTHITSSFSRQRSAHEKTMAAVDGCVQRGISCFFNSADRQDGDFVPPAPLRILTHDRSVGSRRLQDRLSTTAELYEMYERRP
jgi:hypothetical protein